LYTQPPTHSRYRPSLHDDLPISLVDIHIKSMKYGDTLYVKNDQRLFTPASILKILTAEAALLYLGPEYKFPTTLLTDAKNMDNGDRKSTRMNSSHEWI